MRAFVYPYVLNFKQPSGTSRGVLRTKECFFLKIESENTPFREGWGEVGMLRGLSMDDVPGLEAQLDWTAANISLGLDALYAVNEKFPSIQFALEQAFRHLEHGFEHFASEFTSGVVGQNINGLIWMGDHGFMKDQVAQRLSEGFTTLKMKVGAIEWSKERSLLEELRNQFSADELELRVDANGAFTLDQALEVDQTLFDLNVHSIEQPMAPQYRNELAQLCQQFKTPIALDESLIGLTNRSERAMLLDQIKPHFIILKPSFIGGWRGSEEWIELAQQRSIGWWATSALESSVGLNAIAQWTATQGNPLAQGLGTGSLYTNNLDAPLKVQGGKLWVSGSIQSHWDLEPVLRGTF